MHHCKHILPLPFDTMKDLVSNAGIVMDRMSELEAVRNTILEKSRKIIR